MSVLTIKITPGEWDLICWLTVNGGFKSVSDTIRHCLTTIARHEGISPLVMQQIKMERICTAPRRRGKQGLDQLALAPNAE